MVWETIVSGYGQTGLSGFKKAGDVVPLRFLSVIDVFRQRAALIHSSTFRMEPLSCVAGAGQTLINMVQ